MKVSDIKNLVAPITIDYRGLTFELGVHTEKFNDDDVRARAEASVPPLSPEPDEPAKPADDATHDAEIEYNAALEAYRAAHAAYREESRERRKMQDAAFMAEIICSWKVNGEAIDGEDGQPLPVTAQSVRSLGDVLPAVFFQAIQTEILRPLKPVNLQNT
jgi:hypothetical protein